MDHASALTNLANRVHSKVWIEAHPSGTFKLSFYADKLNQFTKKYYSDRYSFTATSIEPLIVRANRQLDAIELAKTPIPKLDEPDSIEARREIGKRGREGFRSISTINCP